MVTGSSSAALLWSIGALADSPPIRPKMWRATSAAMRLPMPMSAYSSSSDLALDSLSRRSVSGLSSCGARPSMTSACDSSCWPSVIDSGRLMVRRWWRIAERALPVRTELRNGDIVEVVTDPLSRPSPTWLSFVHTGKARSAIRHHLRTINLPESITLGQQLLSQALVMLGLAPQLDEPLTERLLNESSAKSLDELYADIGIGKRMAALVARHIFGLIGGESASAPIDHNSAAELDPVTICGSEGVSVQLGQCCLPIPGDQILGQLRRDQGLLVHTSDCTLAKRQKAKEPDRWIAVKWGADVNRRFDSRIKLLIKIG